MTKAPANPFEWRRYTEEEDVRRGVTTAASPKKRVRNRAKTAAPITSIEDNRLKPRGFTVYNKVVK